MEGKAASRTSAAAPDRIGWGIVGLGRHARDRMLPRILRSPAARLVGIYTRDETAAGRAADEYGVRAYGSLDALLADPEIRLVYIATPHDVHAPQTLACAAAGKHVLVEKPMALSPEEAAVMVRACRQAGVRLLVGFQLRHHPAHQMARAFVAERRLGEVVWVYAAWTEYHEPYSGWRRDPRRSGGHLLTQRGVHLIDLLRFVSGAEFAAVGGDSDGLTESKPADTVTCATARLTTGALAGFACAACAREPNNVLEIHGTEGSVVCCGTLGAAPGGSITAVCGGARRTESFGGCDILDAEIASANAAVGRQTAAPPAAATGEDGWRAAAVTSALVESVRTGRRISVPAVTA